MAPLITYKNNCNNLSTIKYLIKKNYIKVTIQFEIIFFLLQIKICRWGMKVFAYPTMQDNLCGLCGNWDRHGSNDLRFRNGNVMAPPKQKGTRNKERIVDPIYGNDWEVIFCLIKILCKKIFYIIYFHDIYS